jgi:two-component system response regulator DesR
MMIRVVIAEDEAIVAGALAALLGIERDIEVVGTAYTGREALELVRREHPDVLLTDIEMPEMTGLKLAAAVRSQTIAPRVVILTTFARPGYLRRALDAGAAGHVLRDAPASQLADAIRRVHAGGRAIDSALATEAWTEADPLTDRERQVLRLAGDATAAATSLISYNSLKACGTICRRQLAKLAAGTALTPRIARTKGWL